MVYGSVQIVYIQYEQTTHFTNIKSILKEFISLWVCQRKHFCLDSIFQELCSIKMGELSETPGGACTIDGESCLVQK